MSLWIILQFGLVTGGEGGELGGNELLDKQLLQRSVICSAFPGGGLVSKAVSRVISLLLCEGLYYSCRH